MGVSEAEGAEIPAAGGGGCGCGCGGDCPGRGAGGRDCGCAAQGDGTARGGGGQAAPSLAYVLGTIGFDYGWEARRDTFMIAMQGDPFDPGRLVGHLRRQPTDADSLIWTMNVGETPVYALQPFGPFAHVGYERLAQFLHAQATGEVEVVSVPGYLSRRSLTLMSGVRLPVLVPELRGMFSWNTAALITAVAGDQRQDEAVEVRSFLERIYHELRNPGIEPRHRALNYAATNIFQMEAVFRRACAAGLKLDGCAVERAAIARPGADAWDVKLTFFNPKERLTQARTVHLFTVDVSDVVPVPIGKLRSWQIY